MMRRRSPESHQNVPSPAGSPNNMSDTPKSKSPQPGGLSKSPFPSDASENSQMDVYYPGQQFESPAPIDSSPYPIPSSQMRAQTQQKTQYIDRDIDQEQAEFEEFRAWKRAQQQAREEKLRQQQQQQHHHQVQVRYQPQPPTVLPHFPQSMTPAYNSNFGYGPGNMDLGQMHGLPGQRQMETGVRRPGHRYGNVYVSGNAGVIRGNGLDESMGGARFSRQHEYNDIITTGNAKLFDGDVPASVVERFLNQKNS